MPIILDGDVTVAPPVLPEVRVAPPGSTTVTVLPVAGPTGPQGIPGATGPQGPVGPPGGTVYTHTQSTPAATWVIDHNLGRRAHVTLFATTTAPWRVAYADVEHGSLNQTTIMFPEPVSGSAVIS